ncbi:hypothetical protein Q0N12_17795 [Rossellomorea marisflavi]|uniref:hypothetical protein n=1 Tax=Rossellomorea marisflavi TaxID=189381 RepID=UPI0034586B93
MRKYTQIVTARMTRMKIENDLYFFRQRTHIRFGTSESVIGIVFMTNPGSFEFKQTSGWNDFKSGLGNQEFMEAESYADVTMQNIIEVINQGFRQSTMHEPDGIVKIFNISNLVQTDSKKVSTAHTKLRLYLGEERIMDMLEDPVVHSKIGFHEECNQAMFLMMGFVRNVFPEHINRLVKWAEPYEDKLIVALDNKKHPSHPRRWRTEKDLGYQAVQRIADVEGEAEKKKVETIWWSPPQIYKKTDKVDVIGLLSVYR